MAQRDSFWHLYLQAFYRPTKAFTRLLSDERKLLFGLFAALIPGLGYTIFYMLASAAGGAPSSFKPWLALPMNQYFFYAIFLAIPAYLLSLLAASGTMHILAKMFGGRGSFEETFAVVGFGIGIATWSSMIHDLADALLGFLGIIDIRAYEILLNQPTFWRYLLLTLYMIYLSWFLLLFTLGINKSQKLNRTKSFIIAFLGFAVFQTVLLIFIR